MRSIGTFLLFMLFIVFTSLAQEIPANDNPYDTVLERIAGAQRTQATTLDLRTLRLTELPSEIGQLHNLEYLDLYANALTSLPPEIGQLSNLQVIVLNSNNLAALPPEIGQLGKLRELKLADNPLQSLPIEIGQLASLEELDLRFTQITHLPPELGQLNNLRRLSLQELGLELSDLPMELWSLTNLRVLEMSNGALASPTVPPEIGQLIGLEELDLSNTGLTSLPREIGQLSNLRLLDLTGNDLTSLPSEIGQLDQLHVLKLGYNPLVILPPEIGQLAALEELNLDNTALNNLPPEIGQLSALKKLHMQGGSLEHLPREIGQLSNLEEIAMCCNSLTSLPSEMGQLRKLQIVYLYRNQLTTLPPEIGWLPNLHTLSISNNPFDNLPPEIADMETSTVLSYLRNMVLTATPTVTTTSSPTSTPDSNATSSPPPTLIPTIGPSPTHTPTATDYPALATAIVEGECIDSFASFAYLAPLKRRELEPRDSPVGPPWEMMAEIPPHNLEGYYGNYFSFSVVLSRFIDGQQEIWIRGILYPEDYDLGVKSIVIVYRPEVNEWEFITSLNVGTTDLEASNLFVDSTGTIWGRVNWRTGRNGDYSGIDRFPVVSRFNEETRRFEFVENAPTVPLIREYVDGATTMLIYDHYTRIVLDQDDNFWIFVQRDGLYHHDMADQVTTRILDLSGASVGYTALSPDGSIYFTKTDASPVGQGYPLRTNPDILFQFIPDTHQIISVPMPEAEWPFFSGLLVDRVGRLWLGSIGYRDTDGTWHLIHTEPDYFFHVVDEGSYSYIWDPPWPILSSSDGVIWFEKFLDSGVDGTAWYDPETGEGCQFTSAAAYIIEDSRQTLWLLADGKLYTYPLAP